MPCGISRPSRGGWCSERVLRRLQAGVEHQRGPPVVIAGFTSGWEALIDRIAMDRTATLLTFGLAIGLINGVFVGGLLLMFRGRERRPSWALAALVACLCLALAEELIRRSGHSAFFPHSIASTITLDYLIGPLLLGYVVWRIDPNRPSRVRDRLHLVPFVLANAAMVPFYLLSGPDKLAAAARGFPAVVTAVALGKLGVAPVYLAAAIRRLAAARRAAAGKEPLPDGRPAPTGAILAHVVWCQRIVIAVVGLAIVMAGLATLVALGVDSPIEGDDLGGLFTTGSMFLITGLLVRHPVASGAGPPSLTGRPTLKYRTSPLDDQRKLAYLDRVRAHMEQSHTYLRADLTLSGLAREVGVPASHLSQVLNESAGCNFYDFVNSYRVEWAKRRLRDGRPPHLTVLAVAFEAGFNSKASFNRAFRRLAGVTPTEFASHAEGKAVRRGRRVIDR